ncbi:hypothetical protein Lac2_25670 [Claveliimonas bilis]|uniref:lipopolysaccharide biosynthesis protein n=1 Tax=Claveliimonas bilis TaxID=3028070 RepID=UPI002931739E|nr:oligosaccharide flippase family protein [Claveliimonas bilis]BDZ84433.1 hypothetical protein Lac2_25670 [Claveliimonas bilis]
MSTYNAEKRLAKGTIVYMIGSLMSKVFQMLILPIITASLQTSDYGYYDLIVTTIGLVTPVVTLQMIEGMFRFMFNASEEEQKKTVSTVTAFLFLGVLVLAFVMLSLYFTITVYQYPMLIFLNYVSSIIFDYMQKLVRCHQKNREFAVSGVINTIVMLSLQALTLLVFKMGIDGMLLANAVSYTIGSIYLMTCVHIKPLISRKAIDKSTLKELLLYSAPLIPNSVAWWAVASSDRYIITWFLGADANGVYSIAGKFSQLLTFVTTVFQLAWQESAIMEEKSRERDKFYTNTFNIYMKLLLGGYLIVLPFIKIIIPLLLSDSYQTGWLYNPILLLGAIFSAFSQFYGSAYMVFKKTRGALSTTIIAAIINVVVGIGLVKQIGLFAPALGTAVSFAIQWFIRMYHLRDCFRVKVDVKALIVLLTFGIVGTIIYYYGGAFLQGISMTIGTTIFVLVNRSFIMTILKKVLK